MAGLLNIGLTGLNAAQLQLNTTSHNIVNAGTPGYSRQGVVQTTNDPLFSGVGFFGQGTRIATVSRQYSQFLENQVLSADNRRSEYAAYGAQISQINNLLADPSVGLSPSLQDFFAGVQEVSANPTSVPARQALISSAQALVARFSALDGRIREVRSGVEDQIAESVDTINSLGRQIAELNQRIVVAEAAGPGAPANDLRDQRNVLVAELNTKIKTSTVVERDGQLSVFIGSGQPLVLGQNVSTLGTTPDPLDPTRQSLTLVLPGGGETLLPERLLNGGELGGLLAFRRESLDPAQNRLGLIALGLATEFNRVHALGVDLEGVLGQDFFRLPPVAVSPATAAQVSIDSAQVGALTDSDYILAFDGVDYTITNRNTGASSAPFAGSITFEGLVVDVSAPGFGLAAGESALIQPTRNAARDIGVVISDPRKVAAANPVSVEMPVSNAGTGKIGNIVVNSVDGMLPRATDPHFPSFTLTWDANVLGGLPAGYTLAPDDAYDPNSDASGKVFTLTSIADGYSFEFTLSGTPQAHDRFTFSATVAGTADNRNAARLGALQTTKVMFASPGGSPTATFQSLYSQLVTGVGNKTREVQAGEQTQQTLLTQATEQRDALSGVNLDEEAANLIRYQQAYQASGRVMAIAQRLFDELLSIAR